MAFYQNLFNEYIGNYIVADSRAFTLSFKVPQNKNHGEFFICWKAGPYDLSASTQLTFNYSTSPDFKNWAKLTVDFGMVSTMTVYEVVDALNANVEFAALFTASVYKNSQVGIRQNKPAQAFRTYVSNEGAELAFGFNRFAGYADLPTYFDKDTIANRFASPTANNHLIRLGKSITKNTVANPTVVTCTGHGLSNGQTVYITNSNSTPSIDGIYNITYVDENRFTIPVNVTVAGTTGDVFTQTEVSVLADAGLDYQNVKKDYEHLEGRSGAFLTTVNTVDGSDRVTQSVIYQTGALPGMLGKKVVYVYTGGNLKPTSVFEMPYVLTASDLISP